MESKLTKNEMKIELFNLINDQLKNSFVPYREKEKAMLDGLKKKLKAKPFNKELLKKFNSLNFFFKQTNSIFKLNKNRTVETKNRSNIASTYIHGVWGLPNN